MSARFIIQSDTITQYWHGLLHGGILIMTELKAKPSIVISLSVILLSIPLLRAFFIFSLAAVDSEC